VGILNGIDETVWDPAHDPHIARRYTAQTLVHKRDNKTALREELRLPQAGDAPVVAVISRLVEQKGIDVLLAAIPHLLGTGAQIVILGCGDAALERVLSRMAARHQDKMAVRVGHDEQLAHLIIAGSDLLLLPSRYEPCGL